MKLTNLSLGFAIAAFAVPQISFAFPIQTEFVLPCAGNGCVATVKTGSTITIHIHKTGGAATPTGLEFAIGGLLGGGSICTTAGSTATDWVCSGTVHQTPLTGLPAGGPPGYLIVGFPTDGSLFTQGTYGTPSFYLNVTP